MLDSVRTKFDDTKTFVKKHKTATACAITAAVAWKLSHDITLKGVFDETLPTIYELGVEAGEREVVLLNALEFIEHHGLNETFAEFILDSSS